MPVSRLTLALVGASCALLGAAAPTAASSGGLKVLVTGSCSAQTGPLATAIGGQPGIASATVFDTTAGTPTAADFAAADLVVDVGDNCNGGYDDVVTYGNRLASYVDHGGVVLQTAFDIWNSFPTYPMGRFASGGYSPLNLGQNTDIATTLGTVLKRSSPIVQGLGTFPSTDNTLNALAPGATLLAKWADNRNAIAVKGRVVATTAGAYDSDTLPDLARLARNTAEYFNAVPSTKITAVAINSSGLAEFSYKAIGPYSLGFQCALKRPGTKATFKSCPSHKKYEGLKPGTYTFEVAAVGPGGPDPSPATQTFRIKP
jgi:hypothetical protein